jgi:hypothetical protein
MAARVVVASLAAVLLLGGCGESGGGHTGASSAEPGAQSTPTAQRSGGAVAESSQRAVANLAGTGRRERARAAGPLGIERKFAGCRVRGLLPDPACTPGAVFAHASVSQVCTPGYAQSVRNVPESLKEVIYAEYGILRHRPGSYEIDHLVSLELGGSNSRANLWPEISPGYHRKDAIENSLHRAVCAHRVSLGAAQREIARDWRRTVVGASSVTVPTNGPARPEQRQAASASAGFCTSHECIASFYDGRGGIVRCADGKWSHSGGEPGVCSHHGGLR